MRQENIFLILKYLKKYLEKCKNMSNNNFSVSATISVLPCLHVTTVQSFGAMSKDINGESASREPSFVLLQLVNALKSLQARGIEDASRSLSDVVLCREDVYYRLYLLQGLVFSRETTTRRGYNNVIARSRYSTYNFRFAEG